MRNISCGATIRLWAPRTTRVSVEPEYLLLVDADQVSLQAKLRYNIRTAEVGSLQIEMPPAPAAGSSRSRRSEAARSGCPAVT